jgi:subfamily B ATP-binding cassette protein MsbA
MIIYPAEFFMQIRDLQLLKKYISPYKAKLLLISSLAIISAFFEAINLGSLVPLIQMLSSTEAPGGTLWSTLNSFFAAIGLTLNFTSLLSLIAILFIIGQVILFHKKRLQVQLWFQMSADLKRRILGNIFHADISFMHSQKAGQINDILTRESDAAAMSIYAVTEIMTYTFFILVYCAMLLYISVEITAICLVIAAITLLFLNRLILRSKELGISAVQSSMRLNEFVSERLNLVKLIKIFSTEEPEERKFKRVTEQYADNNVAFMLNGIRIETIFQVIIFFIAIVILYVSSYIYEMDLALILVFIFILVRLTDPLRQFNAQRHQLTGEIASLEKIDSLLNQSSHAQTIHSGKKGFHGFSDSIEYDKVGFSYVPGSKTLEDISFQIRKNEMVALVGVSGGGKSTIVDLLIRLIEPENGRILIDNCDIKDYETTSYHAKIGFVSQDSFLFSDSILNNICYGESDCNRDQIIAAATIAHAHEFIASLPEGYETILGEHGTKISGGQKQRIALARALYKNPEILVLDEATSALDSESEKIIQDSIAAIRHRYTIIAIAHRLSTIENSDRIIVIDKGRIVETGRHKDLISAGGVYSRFYAIQYHQESEKPRNSTIQMNPITENHEPGRHKDDKRPAVF